MPFIWKTPSAPLAWAVMGVMGVVASLGHWLLILAHQRAPAGILAPFIYTQIIYMMLLGYFVFGDVPDRYTLIGAAIVIASGLYLLYRQKLGAKRQAPWRRHRMTICACGGGARAFGAELAREGSGSLVPC
jgi:drug/metabolite transporter (DMT)-like permease